MHAYKLRDKSEQKKSRSLLALQNLPDLPPPSSRRAGRSHNIWLRRVAACFLLISLALMVRSVWASLGAVVS